MHSQLIPKRRASRWMVVAAIAVVLAAGCRQADGPIPVPIEEQPNKVQDIGGDLRGIARGDAGAPGDLLADLDGLDGTPRPASLMRNLSTAIADSLRGASLNDAQAQEVARLLFVLTTAEELNARQIEEMSGELQRALTAAGASEAAAGAAAESAAALQEAITLNRERWYHLF